VWKALDYITFEEYVSCLSAEAPPKPQLPAAAVAGGVVTGLVLFWDHIKEAFSWLTNLF
jgi:hypothetical protein